jgi:hypothetical protein
MRLASREPMFRRCVSFQMKILDISEGCLSNARTNSAAVPAKYCSMTSLEFPLQISEISILAIKAN